MATLSRLTGPRLLASCAVVIAANSYTLTLRAAPAGEPVIEPKVIYGDDDRRDLYAPELDARLVELAKSTAVLIRRESLRTDPQNPNITNIETRTLEEGMGVCASEPFHDQPAGGFCSGFLVGPDLFVTAGHCIKNQSDCDGTAIAFGYFYDSPTRNPKRLAKGDVYRCRSIVAQHLDASGVDKLDYALVKLDRPVNGHTPMKIRRSGNLSQGESIAVMGYPSGIPLKIAGGATVRSLVDEVYFVANLDTYGGNSGSAVVNASTLEVEGILVRGERDYEPFGGCLVSKRCPNDGCRGEDSTKISNLAQYIPVQ